MAGFWRSVIPWAFTDPAHYLAENPPPSATFSAETSPRPIDRLFEAMRRSRTSSAIDRYSAMSVPAVLRGRNLICSIHTLPLVQYGPDRHVVRSALLEQIDPDVTNGATIAQTVEDLLFEGVSWWRITERDFNLWPVSAQHLDVGSVSVNPPPGRSPSPLPSDIDPRGAVVWVNGQPVSAAEVIRFDSPNPGLLKVAGRAIDRALLLDEAAKMYAENPRLGEYFSEAVGADPVSDEEVDRLIEKWIAIRQQRSTGYVPAALEYHTVDVLSPANLQLVELQKQASLDIANALGLDPEDLGISTTSRTYQNAVDRRQDRINEVLSPYMRAITDRLSMGDVTRRGYVVRFDLDDYMRAAPMDRVTYYRAMKDMGAMTAEEIRAEEGLPALTAQQKRELDQAPTAAPATAPNAVAASQRPQVLTLTDDTELTFADVPLSTFAVDREQRTITGLAVPFGQFAINQRRKWQFLPGSLEYSEIGRVKLLRDHDWTQSVGRALTLTETDRGYVAVFKVARGADGDRALTNAEDGAVDGLSIGVDILDAIPDPQNPGVHLVRRARLREVSLTATPAFDDSRVTAVAASRDEGSEMTDAATEPQAPAAPAVAPDTATFSMDALADAIAAKLKPANDEGPRVVNPTRVAMTAVNEALPYRFSYQGGRHVFRSDAEHDFSTDLFAALAGREAGRDVSREMARVDALIQAAFADVDSTDVAALNPNRHRPDMWQPQMDYATPLWDMVNSGTTDGTKFDVPKFNSSSGLVGPATEGTEPASGSFAATLQTITPTQVWGKIEITRQSWRAGGNPQLSGILWDQMLREYFEDREAAVATFLNTLTAAADITLTGRPAASPNNDNDQVTADDLERAIADLQFVRGGNRFRAFAVHQDLYRLLARVKDDSGRPLYPQINPMNANGTASNLFATLNIAGTVAVPSYALGVGGQTTPTNSWLFDPAKVRGWASAPERMFWDFGATVQTSNVPQLSYVTLGIYGDVAFANLDINGVRQVIFDPSV